MSKTKQANLIMCYPLASGDGREGGEGRSGLEKDLGQSIIYGVRMYRNYTKRKLLFILYSSYLKQKTKINSVIVACLLWGCVLLLQVLFIAPLCPAVPSSIKNNNNAMKQRNFAYTAQLHIVSFFHKYLRITWVWETV